MTRAKKLNVRLSPEERRALDILAAREGRKLSELTRELLRSAIEARGVQVVGLINLLYPEAKNEQ
jgi:predicted DNA-binding protein